ncbi:amine oxidase [Niabella pedocola]|uniref:Amine oxidase n=1 Tax=Niabella pedocola TaxID=1752077 RepID=A0ABS8PLS2_9BACT|nr:amine oxidase [Niabella pedocola]MCD2422049.1 amine oxidase [Niabella pedocola]
MNAINPFRSFWMAGYECSDHLNLHGDRIDLLKTTGHLDLLQTDYRLLEPFHIKTVREGIRWSMVERQPYQYDWSEIRNRSAAAIQNNLQVVYDLCHFGFPDDLTPLHPKFTDRFRAMCTSFVHFHKTCFPDEQLIITPINEAGFLAWMGGEVCHTAPYCQGIGWQVKYQLMKSYIAGIKAIKAVDPAARMLTVEPLTQVLPDIHHPDALEAAEQINENRFQCLDMLCGRLCPELGGSMEYLDILGFDYYYDSQWFYPGNRIADWKAPEHLPEARPLHILLREVYQRYGRPILLSETSHPLEDRPQWIQMITRECRKVLEEAIPFWGICLYPVLDRPDWNEPGRWHRCGLWDIPDDSLKRVLHTPFAAALTRCQEELAGVIAAMEKKETPADFTDLEKCVGLGCTGNGISCIKEQGRSGVSGI